LILDGKDPIDVKWAAVETERLTKLKTLTFEQAARQFLDTERVAHFSNEKHRRQL
jgi:hypothetical protein